MKIQDYITVDSEQKAEKLIAICKVYGKECQPQISSYYGQFGHRKDGGYWFSQGYQGNEVSIVDFVSHLETPKKFITTSQDGVKLYDGDIYYPVTNTPANGYITEDSCKIWAYINNPNVYGKIFSTRESAEEFVNEMNKPKKIEIKLFGNRTAKISNEKIIIHDGWATIGIKPSDLEDILHAYRSLQ